MQIQSQPMRDLGFSVVNSRPIARPAIQSGPRFEGGVWDVFKPAPPFEEPKIDRKLIKRLNRLNEWLLTKVSITEVRIPEADKIRLRQAVNPTTAAFIAPNHPEFFTDMLMDRRLAAEFYPDVMNWAHAGFVNINKLTHEFFLKNNTIPHNSGDKGKAYSVQWALKGKGVLIHPEGNVRWTGDRVNTILPGIADIPIQAAKQSLIGDQRPVFIAPLVWKFQFKEDVTQGFQENLTYLEKKLGLPKNPDMLMGERYFELHKNLIRKYQKHYKMPHWREKSVTDQNYYERKQQLVDFMMDKLVSRFGSPNGDFYRRIRHIDKAIDDIKKTNPKDYKYYSQMSTEMRNLQGHLPDIYGSKPYLSQEQMAECLKRLERDLLPYNLMDTIRKTVPKAAGPRIAHVRVAEPIDVTALVRKKYTANEEQLREEILEEVKNRLQTTLDKLGNELEPQVMLHAIPNRFYIPPKADQTA